MIEGRENRPSERVLSEALKIATDPSLPNDEGWGGFDPTTDEIANFAATKAIVAAMNRGEVTSGSDWRTSITETSDVIRRILE